MSYDLNEFHVEARLARAQRELATLRADDEKLRANLAEAIDMIDTLAHALAQVIDEEWKTGPESPGAADHTVIAARALLARIAASVLP